MIRTKKIGGKESNPRLENNKQDNFYEDAQNIPDEVFVSAEPFEITSTGLQVLKDAVIEANNQTVSTHISPSLKDIRERFYMGKRYLSHKEIRKTIKQIEKLSIPLTIFECIIFFEGIICFLNV